MPSILFWAGQAGGTAEYRCYGPGRALARHGWDVEFTETGFDMSVDGRVAGDPDVLVLSRISGDYVPDAVRRIHQAGRTVVVYDMDDWFRGLPGYNPASQVPAEVVATMHQAMREAHLIACSTPELAEGYRDLNRTVVLPNYLDPEIWEPFSGYKPYRGFLTIGWQGAFHWRTGDLELLKPWLADWLDQHREFRFAAVGCPELAEWLDVDAITIADMPDNEGWSERSRHLHPYAHIPAMVAHIDIGLVPLLRNRFNQAKSWIKGLEYNFMGIPAVASPSREYQTYIEPDVNGYLVRGQRWAQALNTTVHHLESLRESSKTTAKRYMIDEHIDRWVKAYASCRP